MAKTATAVEEPRKKSEKNAAYWAERARQREEQTTRAMEKVRAELKEVYEKALLEIQDRVAALYARFAKDNKLSLADAQKLIKSNEYRTWRKSIKAYVEEIQATGDGRLLLELNTLAMRARITRLDKLYGESLVEYNNLAGDYNAKLDAFYTDVFTDGYYRNLYDIQHAVGIGLPTSKLIPERIKTILDYPWSGENYSNRIWENTEDLAKAVKQTIVQGMIQGVNLAQMSRRIAKDMSTSYRQSEVLMRTELCYVNNQAALESIKDAGAERYRYIATLDTRTSASCRALDGKTFAVKDAAVGVNMPPMHVRCRSSTAIDCDEQFGRRMARNADGKNIRVPADMTYEDWYAVYIDKKMTLADWRAGKKDCIIKYKEAKNIQGANQYAEKTLGIKRAEYKGLHLQVANEWNRGLTDTFNRFPEMRGKIHFTGEAHERNQIIKDVAYKKILEELERLNPGIKREVLEKHASAVLKKYLHKLRIPSKAYASSWTPTDEIFGEFAGITFNRVLGKDTVKLLELLKADVAQKFHPVGCDTIRSILDHEIGHQLDNWLGLSQHKGIRQVFDDLTKDELTEQLSKYAWDNGNANKYGEFIAEAWSEYCNNPDPRPLAKKIGEYIEEAYKRWKKKNT